MAELPYFFESGLTVFNYDVLDDDVLDDDAFDSKVFQLLCDRSPIHTARV
jgi:hypothetical protein